MPDQIGSNCLACNRIGRIQDGNSPHFVAEMRSGYVVMGDHQLFRGYSLLLCKQHVSELHHLPPIDRSVFLEDMAMLAEAVYHAFRPVRLNYELLGNGVQHLHWHIFPRHADDPCPKGPVWVLDRTVRYAPSTLPSPEELLALKEALLPELTRIAGGNLLRDFRAG